MKELKNLCRIYYVNYHVFNEFAQDGVACTSTDCDRAWAVTVLLHVASAVPAPLELLLLHIARRTLITEIVVRAWTAVRTKVIVRDFIQAGTVPFGPRDTEGNFVVEAPKESVDTMVEEEDAINEN
ncbi:hypothetical protein PHMEG_000371 [Phytophthora megakarya]|uniref:Uncharacterized protein n=1 Tax=Phytophthora megakarya TaxID=4795 RepID=A0A225X5N2_9STRA|nr:hypothetical protein PHMEG_000371 [Phytophthora megakarya]